MSHKARAGRPGECLLSEKTGSDAADLRRLHWTQTIFLPACWQRALGRPLVMMTSRLLQWRLEAVPVDMPCSSGWRRLGTGARVRVTEQRLPELFQRLSSGVYRCKVAVAATDRFSFTNQSKGRLEAWIRLQLLMSAFACVKTSVVLGHRSESAVLGVKRAVIPSPSVPSRRCSAVASG